MVPAGRRALRLTGLASGRHYVSVTPRDGGPGLVAAERRLPFEGALNFRDLGGYPTSSGGRTRWGCVFRSDALHRFTADDLAAFESLGVRVVYDLRQDDERERAPNPMASLQLAIRSRATTDEPQDLTGLQQAIDGERRLHRSYVGMLALSGALFGRLFSALAEPHGMPAVFHCAGGKDRTGMAAALLLSWLGVDRETILDDYELTARWRTPDHEPDFFSGLVADGMSPEAAGAALGVSRWAMADALTLLDAEYGGIQAYLRGPAGIDTATLEALRDTLIS